MPELSDEAKAEIRDAARIIRADYGPSIMGKVLESYGLKKSVPGPDDPSDNPDEPKTPPVKDPPADKSAKRGIWWTPPAEEGGEDK